MGPNFETFWRSKWTILEPNLASLVDLATFGRSKWSNLAFSEGSGP